MASRQQKREVKKNLKNLGRELLRFSEGGDEVLTSIGVDPAKVDVTKKEAIMSGVYTASIAAIAAAEGPRAAKKQLKKDGVNLAQEELDKLFLNGADQLKKITGVNLNLTAPDIASKDYRPPKVSVNVPAGNVGSFYGTYRPQNKYKELGFTGSKDGFSYSAAVNPDALKETTRGRIGYTTDIFDGAGKFTAGVSANRFEKRGNVGVKINFAKGGQIKKYANSTRKPKCK